MLLIINQFKNNPRIEIVINIKYSEVFLFSPVDE